MKSEIAGTPKNISFNDEELPEGWVIKRLGDIATRITKGATPTSYGYEFQKAGIKFVKIVNTTERENGVATSYRSITATLWQLTYLCIQRTPANSLHNTGRTHPGGCEYSIEL
jgi:hypothetical protein